MRVTPSMHDQAEAAYRRMADEARYRPAAPSDGFGNITVPLAELDLDQEAEVYAGRWLQEEDSQVYALGCPDFADRAALIFTVEAARCVNGMQSAAAARLLRMALAELERDAR